MPKPLPRLKGARPLDSRLRGNGWPKPLPRLEGARPDTSALTETLRQAWPLLAGLPDGFVLHGHAALTLWLGGTERQGFEFINGDPSAPDRLIPALDRMGGVRILERAGKSLSAALPGGAMARFAWGLPHHRNSVLPATMAEGGVAVASIEDLFGRKCDAAQRSKATAQDYLDIWEIMERTGYTLADGLAFYMDLFDRTAVPMQALYALCHFKNLKDPLPEDKQRDLAEAVRGVDLSSLLAERSLPRGRGQRGMGGQAPEQDRWTG